MPVPRPLPTTKTVVRAFLELQGTRLRLVFLMPAAVLTLNRQKRQQLARSLKRAQADLFYAREKRIAQVGQLFQPMFWATRVILPTPTRRFEEAISRCAGLAASQAAYQEWYQKHVAKPRAELRQRREDLDLPRQAEHRAEVEAARRAVGISHDSAAQLRHGLAVLSKETPAEVAVLERWQGREDELVARVAAFAKGQRSELPPEEYRAAVRAGRLGYLLRREDRSAPLPVPQRLAAQAADIQRAAARLEALGGVNPFTRDALIYAPSAAIGKALEDLRAAGLLSADRSWTAKSGFASKVSPLIADRLAAAAKPPKGPTP